MSERTPTVTTLDDPWRKVRSREAGFAGVEWNRAIEIESVSRTGDIYARVEAAR